MNNKRFYLGKLKSGSLKEGENIKILPNNESNVIKKIHRFRKKKLYASEHENISIELKKNVDASRGSTIIKKNNSLLQSSKFEANIIWMNKNPAYVGRTYYIKIGLFYLFYITITMF